MDAKGLPAPALSPGSLAGLACLTGSCWPVKEGVRERGLSWGPEPAGCSSLGAGAPEETDSPAELADSWRVGEPASSCFGAPAG